MRLSKRTRYGLRFMFELALNEEGRPVQLSDIARKEEISRKFLSQIAIPLKGAGIIQSSRGVNGGYSLSRSPKEITVEEIVRVLEGDTSLVECVEDPPICHRIGYCVTRDVWGMLSAEISGLLRSISLADLVDKAQKQKEDAAIDFQI
ncbi:MAG: Rrf2 family transcriptional regulator [Spirochaetales bacterium]|nr:Rrf2 family transcriptional regulator [Spirochaetales bacterium]